MSVPCGQLVPGAGPVKLVLSSAPWTCLARYPVPSVNAGWREMKHVQGSQLGRRGRATCGRIPTSREPPLQPDSPLLFPVPPLCLRLAYYPPLIGGPAAAMLLVLPCLLQGDLQGCPVSVSCGSCRARPQFTLCLTPACPWLGTLASIQPTDYTHTRPCPIHKPHLGHPCVVCLLEREWVGGQGTRWPYLSWHSHDNGLTLALMQFVEPGKGQGGRTHGWNLPPTSSPSSLCPPLPVLTLAPPTG